MKDVRVHLGNVQSSDGSGWVSLEIDDRLSGARLTLRIEREDFPDFFGGSTYATTEAKHSLEHWGKKLEVVSEKTPVNYDAERTMDRKLDNTSADYEKAYAEWLDPLRAKYSAAGYQFRWVTRHNNGVTATWDRWRPATEEDQEQL